MSVPINRLARLCASLLVVLASSGCAADSAAPLSASAQHYLLRIDQLNAPGFTVLVAAHPINARDFGSRRAAPDPGTSATPMALPGSSPSPQPDALRVAASVATNAATVSYFRAAGALDTSNGPIDVEATAVNFPNDNGAALWFTQLTHQANGVSGNVPVSTGPIGDDAAGFSQLADVGSGTVAAQITVQWRTANVVSIVVVRGRYGGTGIDDALELARQQQDNLHR